MAILYNPKTIRIEPNTLVILYGVQNSGKTTFAKNHFKDFEHVVSTDDILLNFYRELPTTIDKTSVKIFDQICEKTLKETIKRLQSLSSSYGILDAGNVELYEELIAEMRKYYKNIIQVVLFPPLPIVLRRPPKISLEKLSYGIYPASLHPEIIIGLHNSIDNLIKSKAIDKGADNTYIFSNSNPTTNVIFSS